MPAKKVSKKAAKKTVKKAAKKTVQKTAKKAAKKVTTKKVAKKTAKKPKAATATPIPDIATLAVGMPTHEDIKIAAYYCYLERQKSGFSGDEKTDWATALEQLCA